MGGGSCNLCITESYVILRRGSQLIKDMKTGKAAGPSGIVAEMLKTSGEVGLTLVTRIVNQVVQQGVIPNDWHSSIIVNCYKGKGDALERDEITTEVLNLL